MKSDPSPIKAEDILTDDSRLTELDNSESHDPDLLLAQRIKKGIAQPSISFSDSDKNALEERILASIAQEQNKTRWNWWAVAAGILALVGLVGYWQFQGNSDLQRIAANQSLDFDGANTQLIIASNEAVDIDSKESELNYTVSGDQVAIDKGTKTEDVINVGPAGFNTLLVPYGHRSRVKLPDNTVVWLNSGSKLNYPTKFDKDKREVFLQGEAYFEVSRDEKRPFTVLTNELDVRVLGTKFNVSAYHDDKSVSVVLASGSVELGYNPNLLGRQSTDKMVPGMKAVYDLESEQLEQASVDTDLYTSWKDGYLIFENSTLLTITTKLSRYYNVEIAFDKPKLKEETFSGSLDLKASAIEVLEIISEITGTKLEKEENIIRICEK